MSAFLPPQGLLRRKLPCPATVTISHPTHRPAHPVAATQFPPISKTPPPVVQSVATKLRDELPSLFDPATNPDYSLYSPQVVFEDPLNRFRGTKRYAANIAFLNKSPVFSQAKLTLYDLRIIGKGQDTVRTRWCLFMQANLPWKPVVAFTGQSDYVIDLSDGSVIKHVDYWDSLDDSAFFSFPAVKDLVSQCRPRQVGPLDLGGFQLLRRTKQFQIRTFEANQSGGIEIEKDAPTSGIQTWRISDRSSSQVSRMMKNVAVVPLEMPPSTMAEVDQLETDLRLRLQGAPFATPADRCFVLCCTVRGETVYELWLELSSASAPVDE